MKKMAAFFSDSAREFQNVRTVTACGLFAALAFILESFSIQLGEYIKIGFSGLPNEMVDFCSARRWAVFFPGCWTS